MPDGTIIQKISLFTATGKKVLEKEFRHTSAAQTIDASSLGQGMYLIKVQTTKGETVSSVVPDLTC